MNIAINTITAICMALLTAAVIYTVTCLIVKKRQERIAFIRSFKKGKCVAIFLIAIPLFCLGYLYSGVNVIESIFTSITHVAGLVVLKFNLHDIPELLGYNLFYKITVYYCCVLVTLNAVLFAVSLTSQRIWQWVQRLKIKFTSKDKLYIFGNNNNSRLIYKSEKSRMGIVVDKIADSDKTSMYMSKIGFISCQKPDGVVDGIFKSLTKKSNNIIVVINTENDEENLKIGRLFIEGIDKINEEDKPLLFEKLNVHIFGDPKYEAIYNEIVTSSHGCLHYKNKYRMIAMNFIEKYPLTKFMDERHIDYQTSLLKPNVVVNVCMIGFGKPNQQIFLTSVANNQFITTTKTGVGLKQVHYHIFDRTYAENNKGLNHSYYRFKNESASIKHEEYLPLPDLPAREDYYHMDINDPSFYNKIHEVITAKKTDANFVIVSFENDLENIDMGQKLSAKCREWGVDNITIFVRVKAISDYNSLLAEKNMYLIGNESESVYNITEITADDIYKMAQMRNEVYDLEYRITSDKNFVVSEDSIRENCMQAKKNWFITKGQLERESSLYCCLSLQSKLNLMGLEYCKAGDNDLPALSEAEYLSIYAANDMPDTTTYNIKVDGKNVVNYTLDFPESKRKNQAILEHLRWNSFMISQGVVPASKEQILNEKVERNGKLKYTNGKNYGLRRHGNLTTFDGLVTFRQMVAERDGGDEADYDVIKYDYQLLDDAYWLLTKNNCKIVKREH